MNSRSAVLSLSKPSLMGLCGLMQSGVSEPVNIGSRQYVTVKGLIKTGAEAVAGKRVEVPWVDGPVEVKFGNISNDRIESLGWSPRYSLRDRLGPTGTNDRRSRRQRSLYCPIVARSEWMASENYVRKR
jgi:nucleoside-diphosphate-sugar epimerase